MHLNQITASSLFRCCVNGTLPDRVFVCVCVLSLHISTLFFPPPPPLLLLFNSVSTTAELSFCSFSLLQIDFVFAVGVATVYLFLSV